MNDIIPKTIDELYEIREYDIINDAEFNRVLNIMLPPCSRDSDSQSQSHDSPLPLSRSSPVPTRVENTPEFVVGTTEVKNDDGTFTRTINNIDNNGQKIQTVQRVMRTTKKTQVLRRVIQRRNLLKFGQCAGQDRGPESGITNYGESVTFDIAAPIDLKKEDKDTPEKGALITCRKCGESGHWTMHCPHNDQTIAMLKQCESETLSEIEDSESDALASASTSTNNGKYVPPSNRSRNNVPDAKKNLRISNLSEDAVNNDLIELFSRFGQVKSARVIRDRNTGVSRGFAYVEFEREDDAQAALTRLQGYAYGHQILKLEWSAPKK